VRELLGSVVTVTVPARADFVHVLRSVTAGVAARLDFSFDGIEDLRIAVDEACAQLLSAASAGNALTLRITPTVEGLNITASIDATGVTWPPPKAEKSLTWQVLSALADEAGFEQVDHSPAVRLTKRLPPSSEDIDEGSVPSR
jgi:serine/threonine-protein kinase RsbW